MNKRTINVNRLNRILEKHFKIKNVVILEIEGGSQHHPKSLEVGWGGILNIIFEYEKKQKEVRK